MLKGAMNLIDEDRAEALYAARVDPRVISGGSAANTIVGVASFGVSAAYIGKVKRDPLGATFADDIRSTGVAFSTPPAEQGPSTGRCFIYVTPDGERTMNTYLGASSYLAPVDVDEALVKSAKVVYLEGYMWDRPAAKAAFQKAGEIARAANRRVALTLSDSFCVDRFRGEFIELMRSRTVDTVFANTDEILSLYETPNFDEALDSLRAEGVLGVVTRSEKGCIIVKGDETWEGFRLPDRRAHRHHGRRRHVRRRLSGRPRARARHDHLRGARRAGRGGNHSAPRRAAQCVAGGTGAPERLDGLIARSHAERTLMAQHLTVAPEEAADRLAIRELVDAYAHCADRRDAEGQMALFTEDTRFLVFMDSRDPNPSQTIVGRVNLKPVFDNLRQYEATTHFNGQSTVVLSGAVATGESYCIAHHVQAAKARSLERPALGSNRSWIPESARF